MTLREQLAVHAPPVPDWYVVAPAETAFPDLSGLTADERSNVQHLAAEGYDLSAYDRLDTRDRPCVREALASLLAYYAARNDARDESYRRRLFSWPWVYADGVLAVNASAEQVRPCPCGDPNCPDPGDCDAMAADAEETLACPLATDDERLAARKVLGRV